MNVLAGLVRTRVPVPSLMMSPEPAMAPEIVRPCTLLEACVSVEMEKRTPPFSVTAPANSRPRPPWLAALSRAMFWPAKVIGVVSAIVLLAARIAMRSEYCAWTQRL